MDEERDYIIKVLKNYGYKNIDDLIDRKIDKDVLYTILDRFFSYYRIQEQEDKKASTDKK
jgi:hypothetical protein